jgi:hypothetical protein
VRARVQHPQVKTRKERPGSPWVFRYWVDVALPDGSLKPLRKYQELGPSKGADAVTKKQAEIERDKILARVNAPTVQAAVEQVVNAGAALFRDVACMYEQGYLSRKQIATPTRVKDEFYLRRYIVPQWGAYRLNQIQPKAVEDWLHVTFKSWWTMHGPSWAASISMPRGTACGKKASAVRQAGQSWAESNTGTSGAS